MLFRRRDKAGDWERVKVWLWPRVSWRRSALYFLKRVLRLSGTPYAIAMGAAAGAAAACTPFLGFHFLLGFALAWMLRGNLVAAALGSFIGNPLTFPVIWAASYEIGQLMLGRPGRDAPAGLAHELVGTSWDRLWPLLKPMAVGSVPIGLAVGCIVYLIVYKTVAVYQLARRARFAEGGAEHPPGKRETSAAGTGRRS